ncbi:Cyclin-B1-2 [Platanthera zijinensis]|uniref:Cyclin-B1-2 n=1 Tax=Platanthera zijinensis TaxID=2320716 RepID=A0AAP0FTR5_9ASPA
MAGKSISHDVSSNIDALRFGLEGVKGDIVGSHPLESLRETATKNLEGKKRIITDLTYGSSFNLKMDLDKQILSRFDLQLHVI